jgi:hypothetical protein
VQRSKRDTMTGISPAGDMFWSLVDIRGPDECWPWKRSPKPSVYGQYTRPRAEGGRTVYAHREAYERRKGPIPKGRPLDHFRFPDGGCIGPACVNPDHVRPVTHRENILRGQGRTAWQAAQTECIRGHPFDEQNTYRPPLRPETRQCKSCSADRREAKRDRVRQQMADSMVCPSCRRSVRPRNIDVGGKLPARVPRAHKLPALDADGNQTGALLDEWCPQGDVRGRSSRGSVRRYG